MTKKTCLTLSILLAIFIFTTAYFNRFLFLDSGKKINKFFDESLIEKTPEIKNDIQKNPAKEIAKQDEKEKKELLRPLLINEVCAGFDSSKNEFIEIYNPNDFPITLNDENFVLELVNSKNQKTKKRIQWLNNIIPAGGYFLFVGGQIKIQEKILIGDAIFGPQLTSVSGVIISDKNKKIYDKISWGEKNNLPPALAKEGDGVILESGLLSKKSIERRKINQFPFDSDKNQSDFVLKDAPSPQNSLGHLAI